eukprot:376124_1
MHYCNLPFLNTLQFSALGGGSIIRNSYINVVLDHLRNGLNGNNALNKTAKGYIFSSGFSEFRASNIPLSDLLNIGTNSGKKNQSIFDHAQYKFRKDIQTNLAEYFQLGGFRGPISKNVFDFTQSF